MSKRKIITFFAFLLSFIILFNVSAFAEESTDGGSDYPPEFILGDANGSGNISAADARIVLRVAAKLTKITDINYLCADYDKNGKIAAADARYILRLSAGLDPFAKPAPVPKPEPAPVTKPEPIKSKLIKITPVCQYPDYPAGCESVAAVMNLNYLGFNITNKKFIDGFLPIGVAPYKINNKWYSSDPNESFLGDPASEKGWGIWAKGLNTAIQRYLDTQSKNATVSYTYSETLGSLCEKYILNDIPVLVWVTANMKEPYENISPTIIGTNKTFTWISPNHCMLLVGFDETGYYFNDPITGKCEKYSKDASDTAFKGNGSQAVVVLVK